MLPRVAVRAARLRAAPTAFPRTSPIASTSQWIRHYAKDNKPSYQPPSQGKHKTVPSDRDRTWKPDQPIKFGAPQNSKSSPNPVHPKEQPEYDASATPERNSNPQSTGAGPGVSERVEQQRSQKGFSQEQEEFSGPQAPKENTESTTEDVVPKESQKPLPDLRQGIPSTFGAEFGQEGSAKNKEKDPFNVTEDPDRKPEPGSTGGREGGELPKSAYETSTDRRRNKVANISYAIAAATAVIGAIFLGRNWESEEEEKVHPDAPSGWGFGLMYERAKARLNSQVGYYTEPTFPKLLPNMDPAPPLTLVVSLEDLLVHSEWTHEHGWRTAKRPGVDYFLRYLSQYYELVIFTTVRAQDADPIIRKLDPFRVVMWPLFREATRYEKGEYVKDLSYLNRDLSKTVIIDTDPAHVKLQPENAIILDKWKGQLSDKGLVSLIPFLEYLATMGVPDVRKAIQSFDGQDIPTEFAKREAKAREAFNKKLAEDKAGRPKRSAGGLFMGALGLKGQSQNAAPGELSLSEAVEQGKMLSDLYRERAQKQYEAMEKEIRENGEKWLKDMAEEEKKMQEEQMKNMKSGMFSWLGSGDSSNEKK